MYVIREIVIEIVLQANLRSEGDVDKYMYYSEYIVSLNFKYRVIDPRDIVLFRCSSSFSWSPVPVSEYRTSDGRKETTEATAYRWNMKKKPAGRIFYQAHLTDLKFKLTRFIFFLIC